MRPLFLLCACMGVTLQFFSMLLSLAGVAIETVSVLWIPLGMIAVLIGFPIYAVVLRSSLFYGLFDLALSPKKKLPLGHFFTTLAAFAVSASAWCLLRLLLVAGPARLGYKAHYGPLVTWWVSLDDVFSPCKLVTSIGPPLALAAWFVLFAVLVSAHQGCSPIRASLGVLAGLGVDVLCGVGVLLTAVWLHSSSAAQAAPESLTSIHDPLWRLGRGYIGYWPDHAFAVIAAVVTMLFYAALGIIGRLQLGKQHTIPALIGPLMAVLVLGWWGAAAQFFLDGWHIPLLLVVALWGIINGLIPFSDHTYPMMKRSEIRPPAPYGTLIAGGRTSAIVVASAGGGIQAAAWTAKVLEELHTLHGPAFDRSLSLISSISGGSMGSAVYVNWIAQGAESSGLPVPFEAASDSSLDEVSWGLAWPDLLRLFFPLPTSIMIDRALAMERAWVGNSSAITDGAQRQLTGAISDWNEKTASGAIPALIMNSTMVETGGPLLLGTSRVAGQRSGASSKWMDGDALHVKGRHGHSKHDIPAVRGARLSATFPFVSPTARPAGAVQQPHMVDGGFYDNYGMATLTEWLDQALEEQEAETHAKNIVPQVARVLVIEINGFPPPEADRLSPNKTRGGWVKQIVAPLLALANVRTAGQISHRDIELSLLRQKWSARGIDIARANFELSEKDAPLSWHLMPSQIQKIAEGWKHPDTKMVEAQKAVADFLGPVI